MCLAAARPELFGDRVRGVALVSTSAGDLTADPRSAAGRMAEARRPAMLNAALGGAAGARAAARSCCRPTHPRHQKMVRDLLYGADATDEMVLAGAEIMHASTVRSFVAFMPGPRRPRQARGAHRADRACRSRSSSATATSSRPKRHSRQLAEALPDADAARRRAHRAHADPGAAAAGRRRDRAAAGRRHRRPDGRLTAVTASPAPEPARLRRTAGDRRAQLVQIGLELLPTTPVQELTIDEVARRAASAAACCSTTSPPSGSTTPPSPARPPTCCWSTCCPRPGTPPRGAGHRDARPLRRLGRDLPGDAPGVRARRGRRRPVGVGGLRGHPRPGWSTSRSRRSDLPGRRPAPAAGAAPGSPSPRTSSASGPASRRCPARSCSPCCATSSTASPPRG